MPTKTLVQSTPQVYRQKRLPTAEELPYEDGEPLETHFHHIQMTMLINIYDLHTEDSPTSFVGGNMFIHYNPEVITKFRGPDFFVVLNTDPSRERLSWVVWEENYQFPNVIIEISSPSSIHTDKVTKKELYERTWKTPNYFIYNPGNHELIGYQLKNGIYQKLLTNDKGWLWCDQLQLWIGHWEGSYLKYPGIFIRFFDKHGNMLNCTAEQAVLEATARINVEEKAVLAEEKARQETTARIDAEEKAVLAEEKARQEAIERIDTEEKFLQAKETIEELQKQLQKRSLWNRIWNTLRGH